MEIRLCKDSQALGAAAAEHIAALLNAAIRARGAARLVLSTGASQFDTLAALIDQPVDWSRVEMFHLDEYVGLPETHPASFRKYLKERFTSRVPLKAAHFVDGTPEGVRALCAALREAPVDVGVIGIGENAHIAFNDPPADFETDEAYIVVTLNEACKHQQCGEGWFASEEEVPCQAVSMSARQIMRCEHIVSCVPYAVKAEAIRRTLTEAVSPDTPATLLKRHPDFMLFVEQASFAQMLAKPIAWEG